MHNLFLYSCLFSNLLCIFIPVHGIVCKYILISKWWMLLLVGCHKQGCQNLEAITKGLLKVLCSEMFLCSLAALPTHMVFHKPWYNMLYWGMMSSMHPLWITSLKSDIESARQEECSRTLLIWWPVDKNTLANYQQGGCRESCSLNKKISDWAFVLARLKWLY